MTPSLAEYLERSAPVLPSVFECSEGALDPGGLVTVWRVPGSGWRLAYPYRTGGSWAYLAHWHEDTTLVEPHWDFCTGLIRGFCSDRLSDTLGWSGRKLRVLAEALLVLDDYAGRSGYAALQAAWALGGYAATAQLLGPCWLPRAREP